MNRCDFVRGLRWLSPLPSAAYESLAGAAGTEATILLGAEAFVCTRVLGERPCASVCCVCSLPLLFWSHSSASAACVDLVCICI